MSYDYTLAEGEPGELEAHSVDCTDVRARAENGEFVATMIGCPNPLPADIPRHTCLTH